MTTKKPKIKKELLQALSKQGRAYLKKHGKLPTTYGIGGGRSRQ